MEPRLATLCSALETRGRFPLTPTEYKIIQNIEVAHRITLKPLRVSNGSGKTKGPPAPTDPAPQFESTLDAWDAKANRIKTGMTYEEMVAVAGTPRLTQRVTGFEIHIYDPTK
jgi:hypothetical protein